MLLYFYFLCVYSMFLMLLFTGNFREYNVSTYMLLYVASVYGPGQAHISA